MMVVPLLPGGCAYPSVLHPLSPSLAVAGVTLQVHPPSCILIFFRKGICTPLVVPSLGIGAGMD
jgi:hypothetical protein